MANLSDRIRNLTPEQQELLRRRMQLRDVQNSEPGSFKSKTSHDMLSASSGATAKVEFSLFFFSADVNLPRGRTLPAFV